MREEALPQRPVVLDVPLVHDAGGAGAVGIRVGVDLRRPAVGGPPRVADSHRAGNRALAHHLLEAADLAGMTPDAQHAAVGHREPGRVVA